MSLLDEYNLFVTRMFEDNRDERRAYGQAVISKEQYIIENNTFLEDQFWLRSWGEKKWVNDDYK